MSQAALAGDCVVSGVKKEVLSQTMGQAQGVSGLIVTGLQGGAVVLGVSKKGCLVVADAVCQVGREASRAACRANLSRNVVGAGDGGRQVQWVD